MALTEQLVLQELMVLLDPLERMVQQGLLEQMAQQDLPVLPEQMAQQDPLVLLVLTVHKDLKGQLGHLRQVTPKHFILLHRLN